MAAQQMIEGGHVGYMFPLILPLTTALVGLIVFYYWYQNKHIVKLGNLIPGKTNNISFNVICVLK